MAAIATQAAHPWWEVDLGQSVPISFVQVWPRTDACCLDRLHNFLVFVSDTAIASDDPYAAKQEPDVTNLFVLGMPGRPTTIDVHGSGRYVRIQKSHPGTMDLAEIQVWSDHAVPLPPGATATSASPAPANAAPANAAPANAAPRRRPTSTPRPGR